MIFFESKREKEHITFLTKLVKALKNVKHKCGERDFTESLKPFQIR
jgi:hypothetical protein